MYQCVYSLAIYYWLCNIYKIIVLSNYFPKIQLTVMAIVVTIMPFGRPVYGFYNCSPSMIVKLSSITFCSFLEGKSGIGTQNLHLNSFIRKIPVHLHIFLKCCRHQMKPGSINHVKVFYIKNSDLAPTIYVKTFLLLIISAPSLFF